MFSLSSAVFPIWQMKLYGERSLQVRMSKAYTASPGRSPPLDGACDTVRTQNRSLSSHTEIFCEIFLRREDSNFTKKKIKREEKANNCIWVYYGQRSQLKMGSVGMKGLVTWNQTMCRPKACRCNGTGGSLLSGFSARKIQARAGSQ